MRLAIVRGWKPANPPALVCWHGTLGVFRLVGAIAVSHLCMWSSSVDCCVLLLTGTVAEVAPVIPVSAQLKYNIDIICEYITKRIPIPVKDFTSAARLIGKDITCPVSAILEGFCSLLNQNFLVPSTWKLKLSCWDFCLFVFGGMEWKSSRC